MCVVCEVCAVCAVWHVWYLFQEGTWAAHAPPWGKAHHLDATGLMGEVPARSVSRLALQQQAPHNTQDEEVPREEMADEDPKIPMSQVAAMS